MFPGKHQLCLLTLSAPTIGGGPREWLSSWSRRAARRRRRRQAVGNLVKYHQIVPSYADEVGKEHPESVVPEEFENSERVETLRFEL